MFVDNALTFNTNWSTPQAITTTADSTGIIDITGAGAGNAPAMINGFPATNTAIGADFGLGDGPAIPWLYLTVTTAGTTSNTLTVAIKAAPDNGSFAQGSYSTLYTSTAFTGTTLVLGSILQVPLPPRIIGEALPRFYKLTYTCSSSLTVSVLAGLVLNPQSSLTSGQYAANYLAV